MMKMTRPLTLFLFILICSSPFTSRAGDESSLLENRKNASDSIFHVGLWVEDVDEMLAFLKEILSFDIVTRSNRPDGGERLIISDSRGQLIELLSDPSRVVAHEEFDLHPLGRVAGIAHISIQVNDVAVLEKRLRTKGYRILAQAPPNFSQGYITTGSSKYRILFVQGPGALSFELFEIKAD
ncbi:MAG: hypothetical protein GKR93_06635 [Gammaproteobacteria bacterium]|nr:hypothetical protein [Gammaproteobacteria bacterium]